MVLGALALDWVVSRVRKRGLQRTELPRYSIPPAPAAAPKFIVEIPEDAESDEALPEMLRQKAVRRAEKSETAPKPPQVIVEPVNDAAEMSGEAIEAVVKRRREKRMTSRKPTASSRPPKD